MVTFCASGPRRACCTRGGSAAGGPSAPPPGRAKPGCTAPRQPLHQWVEVLRYGTELHLASFGMVEAMLRPTGADDPAFAALKAEYATVLGGAQPGLQPDRCMELIIETGDTPIQQ